MSFQSPVTIENVLAEINSGKYLLPAIQRALEMHAPIGGQFEWIWAVPHVMHALHTPARWGVVPRAPLPGASAP